MFSNQYVFQKTSNQYVETHPLGFSVPKENEAIYILGITKVF
jgi:hypothetical protein